MSNFRFVIIVDAVVANNLRAAAARAAWRVETGVATRPSAFRSVFFLSHF
jgi:hypothetical protein